MNETEITLAKIMLHLKADDYSAFNKMATAYPIALKAHNKYVDNCIDELNDELDRRLGVPA